MLEIRDLVFKYPGNDQLIIDDFSLNIEAGNVYGLLGPNGAGKSTLLYLICGLLTPDRGTVNFLGENTRRRLPSTLSNIFFVPEEFDLPDILLSKYVDINAPYYPKFSQDDLRRYLSIFGIEGDFSLARLSMGQKKKVFMCLALATNTALLLMDEPTNGLDIPGKASFRSLIASGMSEDRTIIISTHQVREIDQLLDHVLIIDNHHLLLNESILNVSQKLAFGTTSDPAKLASALCTLPDFGGTHAVWINNGDKETPINLELLFQLATQRQDIINMLFTNSNTPS